MATDLHHYNSIDHFTTLDKVRNNILAKYNTTMEMSYAPAFDPFYVAPDPDAAFQIQFENTFANVINGDVNNVHQLLFDESEEDDSDDALDIQSNFSANSIPNEEQVSPIHITTTDCIPPSPCSLVGCDDEQQQIRGPRDRRRTSTGSSAVKAKSTVPYAQNLHTLQTLRPYRPSKKVRPKKPRTTHPCEHPGCGKVFVRSSNLRSHMNTHSDQRPFECDQCTWSFARRHDLERHVKSKHSGVKAFRCVNCGARFGRGDGLKRHLRVEVECALVDAAQSDTISTVWVP